ncbi:glycosyltransferase family 39 protein [uncultured Paraburkholderia sp.]|uniref:ArnT family glycosyltransferase n=1 Tax=uncultured Paraburkholderia sp. TaxID=1822466 RepID=UPI002593F075|nr:glycosyltransferase family 39 protein [uncultured Paraburkholderia sp.]
MTENKISGTRRSDTVVCVLFGALLAFFIYQSVQWLVAYRFGQSLDIDESGYLAVSVAFAKAKVYGGWTGWMRALSAPLGFAPMAPAVASLAMAAFGVNEDYGILSTVGLAVATLVLLFVVLRRLSLPHAFLACILLVSMPDFVMFSRSFQFVTATTFFFFASFGCFVLSDGFRRSSYSALVGAALGCMILSRTMALAFLPAFALSFLVYLYLTRGFSRETMKNIVLSIVVFLLVAVPWYLRNFEIVFGYLFSFGYGAHAAEYGQSRGIFTLANLYLRIRWIFVQMHLPHFALIVPAFVAAFLHLVFQKTKDRDDILIISGVVLCLGCFFVLSTSQNMGTGFDSPIYTVMIYCVAAWLSRIGSRWFQVVYFTLSVALFSVAAYAHNDAHRCEAMPKPLAHRFGEGDWASPWINCGSILESWLQKNGYPPEDLPDSIRTRNGAIAWRDVSKVVADYLSVADVNKGPVLLLSRHMILNVNTIGLELVKKFGYNLPMVQIDPGMLKPGLEAYASWLAQPPQDAACIALILNRQNGEFYPRADLDTLNAALKSSGFEQVKDFATPRPDQHLEAWKRNTASCNAGAAAK